MTADFVESAGGDARRSWIDALYRKYDRALRTFLARRRLEPDEVADVAQEAYYRIHKAADVETIRNPRAFLFRVASNVWLNRRKHHGNPRREEVLDIDSIELESTEPGPHRRLQGEQELAIVRAALEELPPKCREAFVMNRFENLSFREIAGELGLSASMIEKHVSHAISHLRKRLNEDRVSPDREALQRTHKAARF